jgi:L-lactate dehydrogenase complex protein LldE
MPRAGSGEAVSIRKREWESAVPVSVKARPRVGLFVTCLVDLFRPTVGFAAISLLEKAGCEVSVPESQTCCGQPTFNSGDFKDSRDIAANVIAAFEEFDYVVAPSGSCAGMIREHYPELFENDPAMAHRAQHLAKRTYELTSFLVDVMGLEKTGAAFDGTVTYHDSCSGLRELEVKTQPRKLLNKVDGLKITELPGAEICCGFGGTFCVKYPEISDKMVTQKAEEIVATGADHLLAGDLGCLLNMGGKLKRLGAPTKVRHVAEVLAGMTDGPAIGEGEN